MLISKFIPHFLFCFVCLFLLVWLGTGFDNEMTFSWYAYAIEGVLSAFYGWTKSADMSKTDADEERRQQQPPQHHHRPMPPHV